ncbi:hypothetical protein BpHYR1_034011 [Brachionus plicatilis]|uniref:Uncharacterized protein n=1 Tax=Brachionus plicatilis TaxID=10195 RepID=A0A3M7Q7H4_BRAPC|nr:hypothetical protein BpHYR1_034011 [Brachionus plicatilis]
MFYAIQSAIKASLICWDPYKRTLNRPKFSETVTVSALAGQPLNGRSFDRSARRSIFWTAKISGLKYTGGQKTGKKITI